MDEVIERPHPESRHTFGVTKIVSVDLSIPVLLDLLSDEPVDGSIEPVHADRMEFVAGEEPKDKENMFIRQFEF